MCVLKVATYWRTQDVQTTNLCPSGSFQRIDEDGADLFRTSPHHGYDLLLFGFLILSDKTISLQ
jgi:hypothetical protein